MANNHLGITVRTIGHDASSIPQANSDPAVVSTAIVLLLPVVCALVIFVRQRYCQRLRQRRIAQLERSWQINYRRNIH